MQSTGSPRVGSKTASSNAAAGARRHVGWVQGSGRTRRDGPGRAGQLAGTWLTTLSRSFFLSKILLLTRSFRLGGERN